MVDPLWTDIRTAANKGFAIAGGGHWPRTIKIDNDGNIIWDQLYETDAYTATPYAICQTDDDGFAITGGISKGFTGLENSACYIDIIENDLKSFVNENEISKCPIVLMYGETTYTPHTDVNFSISGGFVRVVDTANGITFEERYNLLYLSKYMLGIDNKLALYFANTHFKNVFIKYKNNCCQKDVKAIRRHKVLRPGCAKRHLSILISYTITNAYNILT